MCSTTFPCTALRNKSSKPHQQLDHPWKETKKKLNFSQLFSKFNEPKETARTLTDTPRSLKVSSFKCRT
jgi:hypothetical protein